MDSNSKREIELGKYSYWLFPLRDKKRKSGVVVSSADLFKLGINYVSFLLSDRSLEESAWGKINPF